MCHSPNPRRKKMMLGGVGHQKIMNFLVQQQFLSQSPLLLAAAWFYSVPCADRLSCSRANVTISWQPRTWLLITTMDLNTLSINAPNMFLLIQHLGFNNTIALHHSHYGWPIPWGQKGRKRRGQEVTLTACFHIVDICVMVGYVNHAVRD